MALAGLLFVALSGSGCQDARISNLEQRVSQLERTTRELEAERNKAAEGETARRAKLENCVADANGDFEKYLVANGAKQKNGSYNVPVPVLAELQRVKQGKIEECKLLYSK